MTLTLTVPIPHPNPLCFFSVSDTSCSSTSSMCCDISWQMGIVVAVSGAVVSMFSIGEFISCVCEAGGGGVVFMHIYLLVYELSHGNAFTDAEAWVLFQYRSWFQHTCMGESLYCYWFFLLFQNAMSCCGPLKFLPQAWIHRFRHIGFIRIYLFISLIELRCHLLGWVEPCAARYLHRVCGGHLQQPRR